MNKYIIFGLVDPTNNMIRTVEYSRNITSKYHKLLKKDIEWVKNLINIGMVPEIYVLEEAELDNKTQAHNIAARYATRLLFKDKSILEHELTTISK